MSACGFVHTAADLLRLDSHRLQCKSCGKSFPSSQQLSINSLAESQSHSEMAGSGESLDSQFCSASSCFLARILDNPCQTQTNGGVHSTPPRFLARRILGGCCGLRDLGGNAPEDHGCGLLNSFQTLAQQVGVSVPKLDVISVMLGPT